MFNLARSLDRNADLSPDTDALIFRGARLTHAGLLERVSALAAAFAEAGVADDVLELGLGEPHVERQEGRADAVDGQRGLEELGAIAEKERYHVPPADAGLRERGGERADPLEQPGMGQPGAAEDQRVGVRREVCVPVEGPS